ncbi:sulfite exporter TauE/SafE family protein, partial [Bacillus anthracis]|nr:sulfite exporter TauE/SafE family protein [Bacillus anthracis]
MRYEIQVPAFVLPLLPVCHELRERDDQIVTCLSPLSLHPFIVYFIFISFNSKNFKTQFIYTIN